MDGEGAALTKIAMSPFSKIVSSALARPGQLGRLGLTVSCLA
jgi:hypothetical protein